MAGRRLGLIAAGCVLVACAGKAVEDHSPGAAGSTAAPGSESSGALNGALTPELSDTGIPLDSVLGQLGANEQSALCKAYGIWRFRLRDASCDAFVESAVVLSARTTEEARQLCVDFHDICRPPTEPTPACTAFKPGCAVTLAEFDRCVADEEQWLDAVPACQNLTWETAPNMVGPSPDACLAFNMTCMP